LLGAKARANLKLTVSVEFKILSVKTIITTLWNHKGLAEM